MDNNIWHLADRKVRRTLDKLEYELGLRKTLPPGTSKLHYNLTAEQTHAADDRAFAILVTAHNLGK